MTGSDLESKYDDKKETVGGEHESALLQGPAVPEERDEEDEPADSDEDVGGVVQHGGAGELLQDVLGLVIALVQANVFNIIAKQFLANICCNECLPGNLRITQPRVLTFMTESSFVILRK